MKPRYRAALATFWIAFHLAAFVVFADSRFSLPWNATRAVAPNVPALSPRDPVSWNRLLVSRWDSNHYVNLALRGYSECRPSPTDPHRLPVGSMRCDLAYYPGYALAGRLASLGGLVPIDDALLAVSVISSWLFFFLFTGPEIVEALGLRATIVSLVCFNLYTTGFTTVTVQTEPMLLATSMGAFVLARRGRFFWAAIVAGLATGIRVTGAATGLAFVLYLALATWRERPEKATTWIARAGLAALAFWGLGAMLAVHAVWLNDPLIYFHSHEQGFGHGLSLLDLFEPDARWILGSIASQLHEGIFVAAAILWLALGHKESLRRFTPEGRAYWYALAGGVLFISLVGSASRAYIGMNRYTLAAVPVFFAMGKLLERRRLALVAWLGLSFWHYWNVDLCFYVGDRGDQTIPRCKAYVCSPR